MCYISPGPRCTSHAKSQLDKADTAWRAESTHENYEALVLAEQLYDSTPGGQKALKESISKQPEDIAVLELRLEAGKLLRAEQFRKMKETNNGFLPARRVRRGINAPEDSAGAEEKAKLLAENKVWIASLTPKEDNAIAWYGMTGHEGTNLLLAQGEDGVDYKKKHQDTEGDSGFDYAGHIRSKVEQIDSALAKAPKAEEPRILYRSYRVPGAKDSDNPAEVTEAFAQQFAEGSTVTFPAYMSTSIDSDLMMHNASSGRHKPAEHIIFEIISSRGVAINDEEDAGSIQSQEREVLLPRDSKMKVANVLRNVPFNNSRVFDWNAGHWERAMADRSAKKMRVTVVQLIDVTDDNA